MVVTQEMQGIRSSVKESEKALKRIVEEKLADPYANEPEKKAAMLLWLTKLKTAKGAWRYKSINALIRATRAARVLANGSIDLSGDAIDSPLAFSKGVQPSSVRKWIEDYQKYGLDESLTIRRTGSRKPHVANGYSVEELAAAAENPAYANVKPQLVLLKRLNEEDFRLSTKETEAINGIESYTRAARIFQLAHEYSESGKSVDELAERLVGIRKAFETEKDLDRDQVPYQFRVPSEMSIKMRDAADRMGVSLAELYRAAIAEFFAASSSLQSEQARRYDQWAKQALAEGDSLELGGTARVCGEVARQIEDFRGKESGSKAIARIVGSFVLSRDKQKSESKRASEPIAA